MASPCMAERVLCCAVLCSGSLTSSSVLRTTPPSRQSRAWQHQAAVDYALQPLTDPSDGAEHQFCSIPCCICSHMVHCQVAIHARASERNAHYHQLVCY